MADIGEKLRADAQANRERILDVARRAFAADPEVSLNLIAKTAGVGAGTLYRHFPSREALLIGVYRREIETLVEAGSTLLAEHSPLQAFRSWCDRFVQFGEVKHGLADSLHAATSATDMRETYDPLVRVVGRLIAACEGCGDLHPGAEPEDVLTLLSPLLRLPPTPEGRRRTKRVLTLIFRGLSAGEQPSLQVKPCEREARRQNTKVVKHTN